MCQYKDGGDDARPVADGVVALLTNQRRRFAHLETRRRLPLSNLHRNSTTQQSRLRLDMFDVID